MSNSKAGIDYGNGLTNVDHATGIRYGVISMHAVTQAWCDSSEADYGEAHCPMCEGPVVSADELTSDEFDNFNAPEHGCADYGCRQCEHTFDSSECFPEDALSHGYADDGYEAVQGHDDSDIFITLSPFYTWAPFASPCAPGAGYISDDASKARDESNGVKTYCFGHDWFEAGTAPYRVYRVADDSEVLPEGK